MKSSRKVSLLLPRMTIKYVVRPFYSQNSSRMSTEIQTTFAGSVVAIFRHFIYALEHDQSLLPLLSPCFPRQSLFIATCHMSKIVSTELKPKLKPVAPSDIPLELDCARWYFELQEACQIPD